MADEAAARLEASTLTNQTLISLLGSFSLNNALSALTSFDGSNIPLKDFIQDVKNGEVGISEEQKGNYLRAVISKLQGPARDSICGKTINSTDDLIKHLKSRFAPGKDFSYYLGKLQSLRMRQGDTVGSFRDQINILLSCAKNALKEKHGDAYNDLMMSPLTEACINNFIRGLPGNLGQLVDLARPESLEAAYEEAIRLEARMEAHIIPDSRQRGQSNYGRSYNNQGWNYGQIQNNGSSQPGVPFVGATLGQVQNQQPMMQQQQRQQYYQQNQPQGQNNPHYQQNRGAGRGNFQQRDFNNGGYGNQGYNGGRTVPRLYDPDSNTFQANRPRGVGYRQNNWQNANQPNQQSQPQTQGQVPCQPVYEEELRPNPEYVRPALNSNAARPEQVVASQPQQPVQMQQQQKQIQPNNSTSQGQVMQILTRPCQLPVLRPARELQKRV